MSTFHTSGLIVALKVFTAGEIHQLDVAELDRVALCLQGYVSAPHGCAVVHERG
jgi:hypothetical protein